MAQSFNLPARNLPLGDTVFGPFAIPVGTSKLSMTLDVTQLPVAVVAPDGTLLSGGRVWFKLEYFDGATWTTGIEDFTGPWRDKQNVLHNDVTLNFDFGATSVDNGPWIPRLSAAGWQARCTFTVEGVPYNTLGGTLTLT